MIYTQQFTLEGLDHNISFYTRVCEPNKTNNNEPGWGLSKGSQTDSKHYVCKILQPIVVNCYSFDNLKRYIYNSKIYH